ncbi:MAG TPA: hypothetical protein PKD57_11790 [Saprospiraceae bacterium]|nr:hypothetical protein [Saprospiraceae bacterium]
MKNSEFDNWIRSGYNEFEQRAAKGEINDMPRPDWQRMRNTLKASGEDPDFDYQVRTTIADAEVHGYEANWSNFQHKLQLLRDRRQKILTARAVEMALVLLIFWTLRNIADQNLINLPAAMIAAHQIAPTNQIKDQIGDVISAPHQMEEYSEEKMMFSAEKSATVHGKGGTLTAKYGNVLRSDLTDYSNEGVHTKGEAALVKTNAAVDPVTSTSSHIHAIMDNPSQNSDHISDQTIENVTNAQVKESSVKTPSEDHEAKESDTKMANPEDENTDSPGDQKLENSIPKSEIEAHHSTTPASTQLQFKLYNGIGSLTHFISSSADKPEYINEYKLHNSVPALNLRFMLDYGTWKVESGADFYALNYSTGSYINFSHFKEGELVDIIKNLNYKFIQIPLNLHHQIFQRGRWQLSGFAGMNLAICNSAAYTVQTARKSIQKQTIGFIPGTQLTFIEPVYNYGISKDHNLGNNTIAYWNIGFLAEYALGHDWSVYARTSYSNMMGNLGFGPLDERYRLLAMNAGILFALHK